SLDLCPAVSCIEGFCNASEARCLTSTMLMASQKPHRSAKMSAHGHIASIRGNASHYGLAAYVWAHDLGRALRAAHAIEAGWVQVNQGLGQSPGHSYGGYKESGIGREFSLEGMLESYTQRKNVTINLTH